MSVAYLSVQCLNIAGAENDNAVAHARNRATHSAAVEIEELDNPFDQNDVNENNMILYDGEDDEITQDVDNFSLVITVSEDGV